MTPLEQLNNLNKQFCADSHHIRLQILQEPVVMTEKGQETYWKDQEQLPDISEKVAVHRSILSKDGNKIILAVDLDFYGRDAVSRTYEMADNVCRSFPGFFIKYSGNIGFHMVQEIDRNSKSWKDHAPERAPFIDKSRIEQINKELENLGSTAVDKRKRLELEKSKQKLGEEALNDYLTHVLYGLCKHIRGLTTDQETAKRQNKVWMDFRVNQDKLIRGLCVNFKTSDYSVPVDLKKDTVEDIFQRAILRTDMPVDKITIPEFSLYGLANPKDELPKLAPKGGVTAAKNKPVEMKAGKGKISPENFYPCVKLALSLEPGELNQNRAFFLCTYLNQSGYAKEEIAETFKKLYKDKYKPETAKKQIDAIVDNNYKYANPKTVNEQYVLCLKEKCSLWKRFPECFKSKGR